MGVELGGGGGGYTEAVGHVDRCCCSFEDSEGADDGWGHAILRLVDLEVFQGSKRMCISACSTTTSNAMLVF